jgi:hypothetical protein
MPRRRPLLDDLPCWLVVGTVLFLAAVGLAYGLLGLLLKSTGRLP